MARKRLQKNRFLNIAENVEATNDLIENAILSPMATRSKDAFRLRPEKNDKLRPPFERDRHRIIFSQAYRGYRNRTQVFLLANRMIADRMVHVNYVAQVSRLLAKALKLNEDLAEAIAVSHDLGHAPFGHDGERFLNEISIKAGIGEFHHNVQGIRVVDILEKNGEGLNLTFQVRDGILSHDGETHNIILKPDRTKDETKLQKDIQNIIMGKKIKITPATLEGCVMRFSDTIAYIGSDIEDAIKLGIVKQNKIPKICQRLLGRTNGEIIDSIIADVIKNSFGQDAISFSPAISEAVEVLKEWNYKNIYVKFEDKKNPFFHRWNAERKKVRDGLYKLFDACLEDIIKENLNAPVWTEFLIKMTDRYIKTTPDAIKARDYITTLTDDDAALLIERITVPRPLVTVPRWKN